MSDFSDLQSSLARWPDGDIPANPLGDSSFERLRSVLVALRSSSSDIGPGDLAGLIRHVLRRQTVLHSDDMADFRVPKGGQWPDQNMWVESDVDIVTANESSFVIRAPRPWSAEWLLGSATSPPLVAAFAEEPRRDVWPVTAQLPLDPALSDGLGLSFPGYSSPGQRQAIQAAIFLKPGGTLVVNLPTGSGKSLVAWASALIQSHGKLAVMVTPTIALALDQEQQLRSLSLLSSSSRLPNQLAWHSGLQESDRKDLRRRLAEGTQRILIASPESLVTSLSRPLYRAAQSGSLAYFIVDEAHLVSQWGADFRPEFQSMCGLRRELLKECPDERSRFRTLLLSATLTQESLDTLRKQFAEEVFDAVCAVSLRPEPEYWFANAQYESRRVEWIRSLIRVVPRPFILYVTERAAADDWTRRIREMGVCRVGCVHGATSTDARADVIDQWRGGTLDCVVATSAFGLGMDKADVRAVIHACIPESLDRFYQEVGRGGRDGRACVSILVHTTKDREVAGSISSKKIITIEKGLQRWQSMVANADRDVDRGRLIINLENRPPGVSRDSEANQKWNLRTVVLLNQAGLIQIESAPPHEVERKDGEQDAQFQQRRTAESLAEVARCLVRIVDDGHRHEDVWRQKVEPVREALLRAGWNSLEAMVQVLRGQREVAQVLAATYRICVNDTLVEPVPVCAGCPICRRSGDREHHFVQPEPESVNCIEADVADLPTRLGMRGSLLLVACPASERGPAFRRKLCSSVLSHLVRQGIGEFAAPPDWLKYGPVRQMYQKSERRFLIQRDLRDYDRLRNQLSVPRVTLYLADPTVVVPDELLNLARPLHILFAWDDTPDGHRERSRLFDRAVHLRFDDLLRRLNS